MAHPVVSLLFNATEVVAVSLRLSLHYFRNEIPTVLLPEEAAENPR